MKPFTPFNQGKFLLIHRRKGSQNHWDWSILSDHPSYNDSIERMVREARLDNTPPVKLYEYKVEENKNHSSYRGKK